MRSNSGLLAKLDRIDARARELAELVLDLYPEPAPGAVMEADDLAAQLEEVLEQIDAESRRRRARQISEATLDLSYVRGLSRHTSLRLGRRLQSGEG